MSLNYASCSAVSYVRRRPMFERLRAPPEARGTCAAARCTHLCAPATSPVCILRGFGVTVDLGYVGLQGLNPRLHNQFFLCLLVAVAVAAAAVLVSLLWL